MVAKGGATITSKDKQNNTSQSRNYGYGIVAAIHAILKAQLLKPFAKNPDKYREKRIWK
ncbi:MAG: hypothetical protein IJG45_03735 [Oscillospiraceae bacterium]|nr:hypothetical protein [Oscillospiraceae bacterium]